jgi:hypothetical protein
VTSDDDEVTYTPPSLEVEVTEPVEVGRLYGPDGEVLLMIMDRGWVPFGFQPPGADNA